MKPLQKFREFKEDVEGRVGPPLLLWFLGVPGGICVLLWLVFWRGK
jgi:hypothetical protein